ncbi:unnamed protein product [Dibothriocephalus latus]|uniref:Uncharacterized protein n=1 Tax=Dibothriocephalus latus TaxID=60516 RepID=A0A3P6PU90_DIBLA|nr:unnamed protein product [Dibothriocephalus latus]
MLGEGCLAKGDTKLTLGTGSFLNSNLGSKTIPPPKGTLCHQFSVNNLGSFSRLRIREKVCNKQLTVLNVQENQYSCDVFSDWQDCQSRLVGVTCFSSFGCVWSRALILA